MEIIQFRFSGGTLASLLDLFVSDYPGYQWEQVSDGAICMARKGANATLANVQLSYPGADGETREELWNGIEAIPEVSAWMRANRCSAFALLHGQEFREHNAPITIEAGSMTLAQLLDQVALKSGIYFWAILQSPRNRPCSVTITLW